MDTFGPLVEVLKVLVGALILAGIAGGVLLGVGTASLIWTCASERVAGIADAGTRE